MEETRLPITRSLENFNQEAPAGSVIIDSPRSLLVLKENGVKPGELVIRKPEEVIEILKLDTHKLNQKAISMYISHYEKSRQEKIELLKEVASSSSGRESRG